jgi:hypothetical protein
MLNALSTSPLCGLLRPARQALSKLAPHIQQVDMESNGKGVDLNGVRLPFEAGEIDFGEPPGGGQPGKGFVSTYLGSVPAPQGV